MERKLHNLLGALKDKASLTKATLTTTTTTTTSFSSSSSPSLTVLRATTHLPSSSPPHPLAISSLLSFGRSSRLSATALLRSLSSRLSSTRDPSVALKCLLCLHHLLSRGSFILLDTISSILSPSSGCRNPLNLSSFKNPTSLPLSSWVRWYACFLELLISTKAFQAKEHEQQERDRLTSLLHTHLIAEMEALVVIMEEINKAPHHDHVPSHEKNMLVVEVCRLVEEERVRVEGGVLARVREVKERVGELGFGDCVELVWLVRRVEECRVHSKVWDLFWSEVKEVGERVGEVVGRKEEEEREKRRVMRRERVGESARIDVNRVVGGGGGSGGGGGGGGGSIQFSSTRWLN